MICYHLILQEDYEEDYTIGYFDKYELAEKIKGEFSEKHRIRESQSLTIREIMIENELSFRGINPIYNYTN
jgi:hypothetical protein